LHEFLDTCPAGCIRTEIQKERLIVGRLVLDLPVLSARVIIPVIKGDLCGRPAVHIFY
jgi:hypothetical protein